MATLLLMTVSALFFLNASAHAQTITYQGVLNDRGEPANGEFEMKFQFRQPGPPPVLFDPPIEIPVVAVGGRFTALLSTKGVPVEDPSPLELVICVRRPGEAEYVQLDPAQQITATPRAIAAEFVNNVPVTALPPTIVRSDEPSIFTAPGSFPELLLSGPTGIVRFGTGECTIGIDPLRPGLSESDPFGFRLLGQGGQGCRLLFGETDDCTIEVGPPGGFLPPGLLLRDPTCIRVLPPDPLRQPSVFYFGGTDDCTIGIDPPGGLTGLVGRDPVGLRLAGTGLGSRLLFGGPDDLCTIGIDPELEGLIFRDVGCFVFDNPDPLADPEIRLPRGTLRFGDECTIGVDPELTGLVESDPGGLRLLGRDLVGCRLVFGPTDDCRIELDSTGPQGLLLRDPTCVRVVPPRPGQDPSVIYFGPTDDCSLGADPTGPGGLILRDPRGVRVLDPSGLLGPTLRFGPTDDCTIGIDPELPGLVERDPTGFRLLGQDNQGCRLIFGPTMDCTVEVDPKGPSGLLLRDPNGIRVLNPDPTGNPTILFGPTDECILLADPERGLRLSDPRGINLPFPTDPAGKQLPALLTFGDAGECRWRVNAPDTGPAGMILDDPNGLLLVNPQGGASPLSFGETGECRIRVGALPNRQNGLIFDDPNGMQFNSPESFFDVILAQEFIQTSTRRLKENIKPIEEPIAKIQQLEGVTFDWKAERGGKASLGFIAEDVGQIFPEVVSYEKDGVNARGVNYGHLVAVTVEGIKAQQDQIEGLSKENKELRQSLDDMKAQMKKLAAQVDTLTTQ